MGGGDPFYFKMADTGKAKALSKSKSESDRVCAKESNQPESRRSVRCVKRREIVPRRPGLNPKRET